MKCILCDNNSWEVVFEYNTPDKYEKCVGITDIMRTWKRCNNCGLYQQQRNYPLSVLQVIYESDYRSKELTGESIEEAFERISKIPDSENSKRIEWATRNGVPDTLLDIGSGLGIFPYAMRNKGTSVLCTEINCDSRKFINSLGIKCVKELPFNIKFSMVSLIHVLEHMENTKEFLINVKPLLRSKGNLFIEVPSASEFEILDKHHDVFNSCHTVFFNTATLEKIINLCGYGVHDMSELHYSQRNLTSVVAMCEK